MKSPRTGRYSCSRLLACGLLGMCLALPGRAAEVPDEPGDWLESDADRDSLAVNEGELAFLMEQPGRRVLHTSNRLTIAPESLVTGWVGLHQCQGDLDPVDKVEIVYRYRAMRGLRVLSSRGVESAGVVDGRVQMTGVARDAEVCIAAEVKVLEPAGVAGHFVLHSGPFHRRFLDGYYPVRLDYRVEYPSGLLAVESVQPPAQPGFTVQTGLNGVWIQALFEGMLTIRLGLRREVVSE